MGISDEVCRQIAMRWELLGEHLNERQRRLALATEARLLGHGGVRAVARATGVSETTVRAGVFELERGDEAMVAGRARRPGRSQNRPATAHTATTSHQPGMIAWSTWGSCRRMDRRHNPQQGYAEICLDRFEWG